MIRPVLVAGVLGLAVVSVQAGGWAVVTVETLPEYVEAGKPTELAFTVRAHGVTPVGDLQPWLVASADGTEIRASARQGSKKGLYTATLTPSRPGNWVVTIHSGYGQSRLTLAPIPALAAAAPRPAAEPPATRGMRLFVAKGCVTCHQNGLATANESLAIGPALTPRKYEAAFLSRILADPAGTLPHRPEATARMPDLELGAQDIASLVAYINAPAATAQR